VSIEILSPVTTVDPGEGFTFRPRPTTLEGQRIGLLDNGKRNSRAVLEHLASVIQTEYPTGEVIIRVKPSSSQGVSPEMLAELSQSCDVAIAGVGD
jgi:hypothetical protein